MKQLLTLILVILIPTIMPKAYAGDLARYKFYYDEGVKRFNNGEYEQAYKNFHAASICEDAQPGGLKMMKLSMYCKCHFDTAEVCYENELYKKAFYHYSIVAQNNDHDTRSRSKMTICIKKEMNFKDNMALIPQTTFTMGTNSGEFNEQPAHKVFLDSYYIDKTEVSNAQYVDFLNINGSESLDGHLRIDLDNQYCKIKEISGWYYVEEGFENYPVVAVSWYGASDYAKWIGKTLPSEAQWENAFGNSEIRKSQDQLMQVASGIPNSNGVYNMGGNVWEWCEDWYMESFYQTSPTDNPIGATTDSEYKVMRGGAFTSHNNMDNKTHRDYNLPYDCKKNIGFRCVKNCPGYQVHTTTY